MNGIAAPPVQVATDLWAEVDRRLGLGEPPAADTERRVPIQTRRRRGYDALQHAARAQLALVDDEGLLRWSYLPPATGLPRRRAARAGLADFGQPLLRYFFGATAGSEAPRGLGPNRLTQALLALDAKLTPAQGLRQWSAATQRLSAVSAPVCAGPTLLLIHGTFSHSEMFFEQLATTDPGRELLAQLGRSYRHILAFDHATLSVAPWLNALDLHAELRRVSGPIDIVCHSRGGLVASWLLRLAPVPARKVVFVGSPLGGTSLASPHALRGALDRLASVANALALGGAALGTVLPLALGAAGLAKVFATSLSLAAAAPLADAALAMVPGLASQQRTHDNQETARLFNQAWLARPALYAVRANFEPDTSLPIWRFWARLKNAPVAALDGLADLVFEGANDLVVDTGSMDYLGQPALASMAQTLDLGPDSQTWHTSYFRDPQVVAFLGAKLL